ncbi:hypothetical protein V8C42DRAFT_352311 [Trichoderma barbatum]
MDTANEEQIDIPQELNNKHYPEQLPSKKIQIQQYQDIALIGFTKPLLRHTNVSKYFNVSIVKIVSTRAKINLSYAGDLIPLSISPGCSIFNGKRTHKLKNLSLFINGECNLYLL